LDSPAQEKLRSLLCLQNNYCLPASIKTFEEYEDIIIQNGNGMRLTSEVVPANRSKYDIVFYGLVSLFVVIVIGLIASISYSSYVYITKQEDDLLITNSTLNDDKVIFATNGIIVVKDKNAQLDTIIVTDNVESTSNVIALSFVLLAVFS